MSIDTLSVYLPHIQSGAVRALGVSTLEPNAIIPDVPPIANTLAGFEASPVNYITAPAGTPDEIVEKLSSAIRAVASDEQLKATFATTGSNLKASTPEEMDTLVRSEQARWKDVIDSAGIGVNSSK